MPSSFDLHEVTGGVWAAVAPGTAGAAVSNAAIVDLGDKTIVVDTFMTMHAADELAVAVERLTGRAPFLVVNSHWHSDHVRGNRVFEALPIVGTARMSELIVDDAPKTPAEFAQRVETVQQMADRLAAEAETPEQQAQAAGTAALAAALAAEAGGYRLVLPNVLIGERLDIEGERRAAIMSYGRGHTESDLFVHLPDDGVIIAGDLVWNAMHPKTSDGFPAEWAAVLDRFDDFDYSHVVPGHGAPGSANDVSAMAAYLRSVATMIVAARAGAIDPTEAAPPQGFEDWADVARFRAGLANLASR